MPVSTENSVSGPYTPNGVTTDFAFDFKATSADEVVALDQDGAVISSALYSVTMDDDEGGTLSFSAAPAPTDYSAIFVVGNPALTQPSDFDNAGPSFNPAALTRALDRAAARDLRLKRSIDRALTVPFGESGSTLPPTDERKGKFLGFSAVDGAPVAAEASDTESILRPDLASTDTGKGAALVGLANGGTVEDFASRFSFRDKANGDNLAINAGVNQIASDLSASIIAGGGNSSNPNLIGYLDYYTEIAGDGATDTFTSTFDVANTSLVGVFLIRADGVRVQVESFSDISIVGGKAQVTYPTSGNNTNNATGGAQGSDPFVLTTEKIVLTYRAATVNPGSLSDYSGIFGSYDNVIQQGVMQHIVSHAHGRITGGDHNLIAGGSYHRKTAGAYGALVGGTGVKYGASGSGGGTLGATLSVFSGTGPQWGLGASLTMSGAFAGAGGTNVTISGNGSWAFGRSLTISGQDSFAGGSGNSVVGAYSAAFGLTNTCAGAYGLTLGRTNTNSGAYSVTVGRSNTTTGDWALTSGYSASNPHDFSHAIGGESFAAVGDCQSTVMVARAQTTNATLTAMRLGAATQRISIPDQTTWAFEGPYRGAAHRCGRRKRRLQDYRRDRPADRRWHDRSCRHSDRYCPGRRYGGLGCNRSGR